MKNRWKIDGEAIVWDVTDKSEHIDDIEMTGLGASVVYQYGIGADGTAFYNRHCIWPTLRTKPNDTHASFQWDVTEDDYPKLLLNGLSVRQIPKQFVVNGIVKSELCSADGQLEIQRTVFPSIDEMNIYEIIKVTNVSEHKAELSIQGEKEHVVTYTPIEILAQLRAMHFDADTFDGTEGYIRYMQNTIRRMTEQPCELPEGSTEERAAALIHVLQEIGALELLEE